MEASKLDTIKQIIKPFNKRPGYRPEADISAISKLISNVKFFHNISEGKNPQGILNEVSKVLIIEIFEPGEAVFNYGEPGDKFYMALLGRLSVLIPGPSSRSGTPIEARKSIMRRSFLQEMDIKNTQKLERRDIEAIRSLAAPGVFINRKDSSQIELSVLKNLGIVSEMKEVSVIQQGGSFGELALISDKPRAATVEAKEICVLASLSKQDFKKILSQEAEKALQEKVSFLFRLPIFKGYTAQSVQKLSYYFQELKFKKNQMVYKEKTPCEHIYFVYSGEFKLYNTKDHYTRKVIDFRGGFISEHRSFLNLDKAREIKQEFQMQFAIKGKNEIFGHEEYVKALSNHIQSAMCTTNEGLLYAISFEDFKTRITDDESARFLRQRLRWAGERHNSMDKAQGIVEKMVTNDSRNSFSRSSSRNSIEKQPKRLQLTSIPKMKRVSIYKTSMSTSINTSKNASPKQSRGRNGTSLIRERGVNESREEALAEIKRHSRLKRLPPPNFMKKSRENSRRGSSWNKTMSIGLKFRKSSIGS